MFLLNCSYNFQSVACALLPSHNVLGCKFDVLKNQSTSSPRTLQPQIQFAKLDCLHWKVKRHTTIHTKHILLLTYYWSYVRANNTYRALSLQFVRSSVAGCCSGRKAVVYSLNYWYLIHTRGLISFNGIFDGLLELLAI